MDESQKAHLIENPTAFIFDRKFDTAVRDNFYKNYLDRRNRRFDLQLNQKNNKYDDSITDYISSFISENEWEQGPEHYGMFLDSIFKHSRIFTHQESNMRDLRVLKTCVNESLELQIRYNQSSNMTHTKESVLSALQDWIYTTDLPPTLANLLIISKKLTEMVIRSHEMFKYHYQKLPYEEYHNKMKTICHYYIPELDTHFYWSESLFFIRFLNVIYVQPRSIMLLYHNKICDLISVLLYAIYSERSCSPEYCYQMTLNFVKEMITLLRRYKNGAFHIFKILEGLVIAETLVEVEEWDNYEFLDNLTLDLHEKLKYNYVGSNLQNLLMSADCSFRNELGCLSKILGHPLVSMEGGSKALHKKVNEYITVNLAKIRDCINYFKRDYISKHLHKFGIWPPTEPISPHAPVALRMSQLYNKNPDSHWIVRRYGETNIDHYEFVELSKNIEFNQLENIIPHLKDKASCLLRSSVMAKIFDNIQPKNEWENTRLLLAYLLHPSMVHDHMKYMKLYTNTEDFSKLLDYLIIKIVPKEKELKIDYRGFGCKHLLDRHRGTTQEKNVSLYLEEFSDEQTLTSGELEILKKMDAFRRITKAYKGYKALYIVIDASAWNNRFSVRTVDDFGRETLSKIFDHNIFSKTHRAYENTFVYVPDQDNTYYWEGQRGGIEGQNQYTWMTVYITQMRVAMQDFPFKYHIICKGDDMRIIVLIPEQDYHNQDISILKNRIVSQISETCKDFGHKINIEESYGSCHYFAFSKMASIDTIELPQTFRKIQKTYGANNAFINSLDDYIAATFSTGHSSCHTAPVVVPSYAVSITWFYWYLLNDQLYKTLTTNQLISLSLVPSLIGGFPIIYLHNFFVRAESDLLSPFIDIVNFCQAHYPMIYDNLVNFLYVKTITPKTLESLYCDPYSLPVSRPPLPASVLRSFMPEQLRRLSKNRDLLDLLKLASSKHQEAFIECLDSCNVIRAKALALLYSASPKALLEEELRKFESGKAVLDFLFLKRSARRNNLILKRVRQSEMTLQRWRIDRLRGKNIRNEYSILHLIRDCPAESANLIREYAFGKPVEDITMPPMRHQIIMMYAGLHDYNLWIRNNHFNYNIGINVPKWVCDNRLHYSTGPYKPFLGYTTRTGQTGASIHFIEKDSTLKKVKSLLDLCSWMNVSRVMPDGTELISNIRELIQKVINIYTDTDLNRLAPFAAIRKSGTVQHHMRSPGFRESIVPNTLSNIYTFIKGESNSHTRLQTSAQHYRINFLHCYCHMVWLLTSELDFKKYITTPSEIWGVSTDCRYCNSPITETPLIFNNTLIQSVEFPLIRYVRINTIAEGILQRSMEQTRLITPNIRRDDQQITYEQATLGLLYQIVNTIFVGRQSIIDRFTGHVLTDEGFNILSILSRSTLSRDIGLTEIKSMDINTVVTNLIIICIHMMTLQQRTFSRANLQTWLNICPIADLSWYPIINLYHEAGMLPNLVHEIHQRSGIPPQGCYYNPMAATRYLGLCSLTLVDFFSPNRDLMILTDYKERDIFTRVRIIIRNLCYYNLARNVDWNLIRGVRFQDDEENKNAALLMLAKAICVYVLWDKNDEEVYELLLEILNHQDGLLAIFSMDAIEADQVELRFEEYLEQEDRPNIITKIYLNIDRLVHFQEDEIVSEYMSPFILQAFDLLRQLDQPEMHQIQIIYTNLTECIEVVRANRRVNVEDELNGNIDRLNNRIRNLRFQQDENRLDYFLREDHDIPVLRQFPTMNEPTLNFVGQYHQLQEIDRTSFIHLNVRHRFFGLDNASCHNLYSILVNLMNIRDRKRLQVAFCTHDGLGGLTSLLNLILADSIIYFHTTPDDNVYNPRPESALLQGTDRNALVYNHLREGYTKFAEYNTLMYYINHLQNLDIMTSDLEHNDPFSIEYLNIQMNILKLFIIKSLRGSLGVFRVDLRNIRVLSKMILILRQATEFTYLMYPKSETFPYSSYIVTWGLKLTTNKDTILNMANTEFVLCTDTIQRINRYLHYIDNYNNNLFNMSYTARMRINIDIPGIPVIISQYMGKHGYNLFIKKFNIVPKFDHERINDVPIDILYQEDREHTLLHHSRLGIDLTSAIQQLENALEHQESFVYNKVRWDPNTRAHRLHLLHTLFGMYGYQSILQLQYSMHRGLVYDGPAITDNFLGCINRWRGRDIRDQDTSILERRVLDPDLLQDTLYREYNNGVEIYIQLITSLFYNLNFPDRRRRMLQQRIE